MHNIAVYFRKKISMNENWIAQPTAIGRDLQKSGWVQTDKKSHEAWARFTLKKPTASALLHYMCAYMVDQNALVIAQTVLAKRLGV